MKTFMTRLLALPVLLLFAALTAGDALAMKLDNTGPWPVCNGDQAQIDPDGDGWGWQDGETCKYKFDDDDDDDDDEEVVPVDFGDPNADCVAAANNLLSRLTSGDGLDLVVLNEIMDDLLALPWICSVEAAPDDVVDDGGG